MPDTIIKLLNTTSFVSGEEISTGLGISRAGVWKKILGLRKKGYVIEAVPSKGYRLVSSPDLAKDYILCRVQGDFWKDVIVYDSVESTNDLAMSLAIKGSISPGTVLVSDQQTKGKGRLGRTWVSPSGTNIYLSMVIRPELDPRDLTMLTILAAVAVAAALRKACNIPVKIKWPNDLILKHRKLGGILTEVRADPDSVNIAVIGIGINVNMQESDFPAEIREIASSVRQATGLVHSRNEIIVQILREFEGCHSSLIQNGKRALLDAWRENSCTLGRKVKALTGQASVTGLAEDIDENGMLILKMQSGEYRKISAGDITFLR